MAVNAAPMSFGAMLASRRAVAALVLVGIAAAIGIGIVYRASYPGGGFGSPTVDALSGKINQGLNGMKTVADMLLGRSPGERAAGALANLKHKRLAAPHERALPKVRHAAPPSPLAAIVGPPPPEAIPPVAGGPAPGTPLYNVVSGPPAAESPPIVFPAMPPPPPGGGGIIGPPVITQVPPPVTPPPAVPEPGTWAMMLVGFAVIGGTVRFRARAAFAA